VTSLEAVWQEVSVTHLDGVCGVVGGGDAPEMLPCGQCTGCVTPRRRCGEMWGSEKARQGSWSKGVARASKLFC
jgi:hypothetical protein